MKLFLAIPLTLLATALFAWALFQVETLVLVALGAAMVALPVIWLLTSTLWPNRPDRKCPECGKEALTPLTPGAGIGTRCAACGQVDEAASTAFLDAE